MDYMRSHIGITNLKIDDRLRGHIDRDIKRMNGIRTEAESRKSNLFGRKEYVMCSSCRKTVKRSDTVPSHWTLNTAPRHCRDCEKRILDYRYKHKIDKIRVPDYRYDEEDET